MSRGQANTLRSLSVEAYQPKLFEEDLTAKEALSGSKRSGGRSSSPTRSNNPGVCAIEAQASMPTKHGGNF
jgi:hypothetical protein